MPPSPTFRKLLAGAASGEIIVPVIQAALWNPQFQSFTVQVQGFEDREPDGWFHPSTHPRWPERMLYYYLTEPSRLQGEPFDPASTMAVTQGQFWHSFVERVLLDAGVWTKVEVPFEDPETGSRGHVDGLSDTEIGEFKTMREMRARKIAKGAPDDPAVVESFRTLVPEYYAQGQEYMRISGYRRWRALILSLEYPFSFREVAMDYDHHFGGQIRDKYMRVRQAAADYRPPPPCCAPSSKEAKACPARLVCPVGHR